MTAKIELNQEALKAAEEFWKDGGWRYCGYVPRRIIQAYLAALPKAEAAQGDNGVETFHVHGKDGVVKAVFFNQIDAEEYIYSIAGTYLRQSGSEK